MDIDDDRTPEQQQTHPWLVVGTDSFLSGWGKAKGGVSYAAWACQEGHVQPMFARINGRSDMRRVRIVYGPHYQPRGRGHLHIYVSDMS